MINGKLMDVNLKKRASAGTDENDELTSLSDGEYLDDYNDDYDGNSDDEF